MTQEQWLIVALKVATIAAFCSLTGWIIVYTRISPWWRSPIGRTLVTKTAIIATLLIPTTLSLFLNLNRVTSLVTGWIDVTLIAAITPVMAWRTAVWIRVHREGVTGPLPAGDTTDKEPA